MLSTLEKIRAGLYTRARPPIAKSWQGMAGAFKRQKKALERHAKMIRAEWAK